MAGDPDPSLWARYIRGSRAFDDLYSAGARCPSNHTGARCLCKEPKREICKYSQAVFKLAEEIGGATWEVVQKIN